MTDTNLTWRKASFSGNNNNCVEVAVHGDNVLIRDSKYLRNPGNDPAFQPLITISLTQWAAFLAAVAGNSSTTVEPAITIRPDRSTMLSGHDGTALIYTPEEWDAFTQAVVDGEFDDRQTLKLTTTPTAAQLITTV